MAAQLLKFEAKKIGMTAGEIGTLAGGMILTKKFLDFNTLFKKQIEADPAFADKWFIKGQGWIRFGVGLIAASYVKNPWVKLLMFGVALEGAITGIRQVSGGFFEPIGRTGQKQLPPADDELLRLAQQYDNSMQGTDTVFQYGSSVSGNQNPVNEYSSSVSGTNPGTVDLTESIMDATGAVGWGEFADMDKAKAWA